MDHTPVARVCGIVSPHDVQNKKYLYSTHSSTFEINGLKGSDKESFDVAAIVLRASADYQKFDVVEKDTALYIGDIVKTAPDATLAFEFLIGGRVGMKKGSVVRLINEAEVRVLQDGEWRKIVLNKGGAFAKFQKRDQPLTIQTRGGVLGIKG
jgi:hypothetical protein